jgi:rhodanese-related sulfurtransferase
MSYLIDFSVQIECITRDELFMRINGKGSCIVVDTIGTYDGNSVRIRGAKTIPFPEVIDRRDELRGFDEIIIYCRNKECRASKKVASALILLNIPGVKVYKGGIDEWTAHGLPVEEI